MIIKEKKIKNQIINLRCTEQELEYILQRMQFNKYTNLSKFILESLIIPEQIENTRYDNKLNLQKSVNKLSSFFFHVYKNVVIQNGNIDDKTSKVIAAYYIQATRKLEEIIEVNKKL